MGYRVMKLVKSVHLNIAPGLQITMDLIDNGMEVIREEHMKRILEWLGIDYETLILMWSESEISIDEEMMNGENSLAEKIRCLRKALQQVSR